MNTRSELLKFSTFALVAVLFVVLLFNTMANKVGGDTEGYSAVFTDVSGLRAGDDVRVAGVKVGQIDSIEVQGRQAKVEFQLRKDQPLLDNTQLVMRYQNLLGQRYLSMVQPERRGSALEPGATVPAVRTSPGFDLTALLNGFRPLFEVLKPADVNELSETIIKTLQGEGGTVEQLLRQTTRLTNFLADRDELFGEVATNLTPVLNNLAGQGDELQATVVELRKLMDGFAQNRDGFARSLDNISALVDDTNRLVADVRAPLTRDVKSLRQLTAMYAEEEAKLRPALTAFGDLIGVLGRVFSYESGGNVYLCNLTFQVLGVDLKSSTLSQNYSEVCK